MSQPYESVWTCSRCERLGSFCSRECELRADERRAEAEDPGEPVAGPEFP